MNRTIAIVLIVLGAAFILASAGYYLLLQVLDNPGLEPLPGQLAGLPRVSQVTGASAVLEINQMHGKEFPLTSGAVGIYGDGRQATLWISGAPGGWMAERILIQMRDKIADGESPFVPLGERQLDGRTVYELNGLGQKHFYFRSGNLIIWLAADGNLADGALKQSLEFYP